MFLTHLLVAFLVALFLSLLLIPLKRPQTTQAKTSTAVGVLFLFFILFLGTWAGGLWITPFGSPWLGVYWMPFLVVGFLIALLFSRDCQLWKILGRLARRVLTGNLSSVIVLTYPFNNRF